MKAMCKRCGKIVDDKESIKLSLAEYKRLKLNKTMINPYYDFTTWTDKENHTYIRICEKCYRKERWI